MRYENPQLQELLAAEYVVGVLRGGARRRFEALARYRPGLRRLVREFEDALAPLALNATPVAPPPALWAALERRIAPSREPATAPRTRAWQSLAAALAVVALVLGAQLAREPDLAPLFDGYVSVVADDDGKPVWLVTTTAERVRVRAVGAQPAPAQRDYELWLLPAGEQAPVSLGVVEAGATAERALPAGARGRLADAAGVAISLEPEGGSPTGAPTGPILHVAALVSR